MKFNKGLERVRLENRWKKPRVQYQEAGMSEDAIQAMYQFDLDVLNSERAYVDNTQPIITAEDDKDSVDFKEYERAITVTDVYHETKTRFAWVGEIKSEKLHIALENLSEDDLALLSLYAFEESDTVEISKVYGTTKQNISKKSEKSLNLSKTFKTGLSERRFRRLPSEGTNSQTASAAGKMSTLTNLES